MEITGKIVQLLPEQSGQSSRGTWRKQEFILEVPGNYPKNICISMWGENIDSFGIKQGEDITVSIDIESREYNGRWYTNVKAWKVARPELNNDGPQETSWPEPSDQLASGENQEGGDFDDLPF
jgi:hypothetical protein